MNVHHCLFLRPHHFWIHREHCEIENQKMKEAICFLPTLTSMSETTSTKILLFLSTGVFIISFGLLQEPSSLFFVDFIVVVEEIYTSVAWDFGDKFWTYNLCFLQLADCCFSCTMIRKLFSTFFKASTSYGYFHYVSYGIFAHWFSLDQMFKFSVSFATEVEKKTDHRMDVLIEVFAPQKTQREQQITYMTWNPCCYHGIVSLFI